MVQIAGRASRNQTKPTSLRLSGSEFASDLASEDGDDGRKAFPRGRLRNRAPPIESLEFVGSECW